MKKKHAMPDVYQMVTDVILDKLSHNIIPWREPWLSSPAQNYYTKTVYRGINALLLGCLEVEEPYFLTFKQVQKLGGKVRKGAKSHLVVYYQIRYQDASGKWKTKQQEQDLHQAKAIRPLLRYYRVFAIQDVENIAFTFPVQPLRFFTTQERLAHGLEPFYDMPLPTGLRTGGQSAYYHPDEDYIQLPCLDKFTSIEDYFQVLYHEMTHSTGHPSRLNRLNKDKLPSFGSAQYSKEELIAELGSCFLMQQRGFASSQTLDNSTAYIQGWLEALSNDKKFVIEAAGKAQRAVDYILGTQIEKGY